MNRHPLGLIASALSIGLISASGAEFKLKENPRPSFTPSDFWFEAPRFIQAPRGEFHPQISQRQRRKQARRQQQFPCLK